LEEAEMVGKIRVGGTDNRENSVIHSTQADHHGNSFMRRMSNLPGVKSAVLAFSLLAAGAADMKQAAAENWDRFIQQGIGIITNRTREEVRIEARRQAELERQRARAEAEHQRALIEAARARERQTIQHNDELERNRIATERETIAIERELERINRLPPAQRERAMEQLDRRLGRLEDRQEYLEARQASTQGRLEADLTIRQRLRNIEQRAREANINTRAQTQRGDADARAIEGSIREVGKAAK
jgi:hypothetical protein